VRCPKCGHAFIAFSPGQGQSQPTSEALTETVDQHAGTYHDRLDEDATEGLSATLPAKQATGTGELPRPQIPGYVILDELGRGGMGVVYKAQQVSLKRLVALKMILVGDRAGSEQLARFRAEAEAVAHLHHPNIVQIYEIGEHEGRPYLSLEFMDGGSLSQRLRSGPLALREASQLVEVLARAVQHAHQRGIVHRDLKPANILLMEDGTPKISDFGLAKRLEEEQTGLTCSGSVIGTPSYMAPEQAEGKTDQIGPLVDVYALGAILYELLTGRPPFKAETVVETLHRVVHDDVTPPSRHQPKIDRDLETICLKALAKDAKQRYQSALLLAQDLERYLAGEPILARRESPYRRLLRKVRRNRLAVAATCGLLLAMLVTALVLHGARATRQVSALTSQFEVELDTDRWSLEHRNDLETLVAKIERLDPAQAAASRQRLQERFARFVLEAVRQVRLGPEDIQQIQADIAWLAERNAARADDLRSSFEQRLGQWQEVFDLQAPFEGLTKVFSPEVVRAKEECLVLVSPPSAGGGAKAHVVPTLVDSRGAVQLEAYFDAGWQKAAEIGLALNHQQDQQGRGQGYSLLLSSGTANPEESIEGTNARAPRAGRFISFEQARNSNGSFEIRLLRNGVVLRAAPIQVPEGPLSLLARREGDRLEFQIGQEKPLVFFDVVPLTSAARSTFAVHWPPQARLVRLRATSQTLPPAASPLERGDDLFVQGRYAEALALYQGQIAATANPAAKQEAQCRAGLCLVQLNRLAEAVDHFGPVAASEGDRWPLTAACQLWLIYLGQNRLDESGTLLASVSSRFSPEQLTAYVPAHVRDRILAGVLWQTSDYVLFDPVQLRRAEQALTLARLFQHRYHMHWGQYYLGRLYCLAGEEDKALPLFQACVRDSEPTDRLPVIPVRHLVWLMRRRGQTEEALRLIDGILFDESGRIRQRPTPATKETLDQAGIRQMFYVSLYLERARVHAALGKWTQAEQDINELLRGMPNHNVMYQIHSAAYLLQGLLRERRGDLAGAKASWKQGLYSAFVARLPDEMRGNNSSGPPPDGLFYHLMMASLSDGLSDTEADQILKQIQEMVLGKSLISQFLGVMKIQPSVLREMWRSSRGREVTRQMAFLDLAPRDFFRQAMYLGVAEKFRQDVLRQAPAPEQEEQIWEDIVVLVEAILDRKLSQNQMIQLGLTYKGTTGFLGWGGVAPTLDPRYRGPVAYLLGLRFVALNNAAEAANFFRTAVKDAPAESRLRRLAQAELDRLTKN
jgi:serine/threonine protein kinase